MFRKIYMTAFLAMTLLSLASVGHANSPDQSPSTIPGFFASYFGKISVPEYTAADEDAFTSILESDGGGETTVKYQGPQISEVIFCGDTRAVLERFPNVCYICDAQKCCDFSPHNIGCYTVIPFDETCDKVSCDAVN